MPGVRELFEQARKPLHLVSEHFVPTLSSILPSLPFPFISHIPHSLPPSLLAAKLARKTRGELAKLVDADYYGYRDEDDGIIVPLEQEREKQGMLNTPSPLPFT